jgi:8-oxo-dGTP pyrophosphatase MutT (NUDIX family)
LFAWRNGAIMKSDWSSKKERRCFHNIMITFDDVEKALARREPELLSCDNGTRAAVALILRQVPSGMQVLFIERASHDNDPWSGHIGFPGGKVEGIDQNPRMAAERETREEIGLDLREARRLGRLSEVAGATLPIRVSCFVYGIDRAGPLQLNEEVKDVFWVPLSALLEAENHGDSVVRFAGQTLNRPAIRLPQEGKPVLWGLTYHLVMEFLELLYAFEADKQISA